MLARKVLVAAWLLIAVPWIPAAEAADAWAHADAAQDVEAFAHPPGEAAPVPPSAVADAVDLLEVRLEAEDEKSFVVALKLAEFSVSEPSVSPAIDELRPRFEYEVSFRIQENQYDVVWSTEASVSPASPTVALSAGDGSAYVHGCLPRWTACAWTTTTATVDDSSNTIKITVPKQALLGNAQARLLSGLQAGDQLEEVRASADGEVSFYESGASAYVAVWDSFPDGPSPPPYTLASGAAASAIELLLPTAGTDLAVLPEGPLQIPFMVTNQGGAKRVINLAYTLEDTAGRAAYYRVSGPATVTVPADTSRNFTFLLETLPGAGVDDRVTLRLTAHDAGPSGVRTDVTSRLQVSYGLSPEASVLYLLARDDTGGSDGPTAVACGHAQVSCSSGFLSPRVDDPAATPGRAIEGEPGFDLEGGGFGWYLRTLSRFPTPVALQKGGTMDLTLVLRSQVPLTDLYFGAYLESNGPGGRQTLAEFEGTADASPEGAANPFNIPLRPRTELLPAGSRLEISFIAGAPHPDAAMLAQATDGLEVVTPDSSLRLPVIELPEDLRPQTAASPFQVGVLGDRESFVNPGKSARFRLSLLNHDERSARAQIELPTLPAGWRAEARPGSAFDLNPGDAILVDVFVHAPAEAPDGATVVLRVNVTSPGSATVGVNLQATAVVQTEVEDALVSYTPDEDARAKTVASKAPGAPASGALAALGALLALAWRRRA